MHVSSNSIILNSILYSTIPGLWEVVKLRLYNFLKKTSYLRNHKFSCERSITKKIQREMKSVEPPYPTIIVTPPLRPRPTVKTATVSLSYSYTKTMMEPKLINLILVNLPSSRLKELRLTCKAWNEESCRLLQLRELIEFRHVSEISQYLSTFTRNSSLPPNFPYPYSRFHFLKIRLNLIHDNYLLRAFFKKNCGNITQLNMDFTGAQFRLKFLRMCAFDQISNSLGLKSVALTFKEFYEVWPASLTDDLVNLKPLLNVESLKILGSGRESVFRSILLKILPYFPNVSRLECGEQQGRLIFDIVYGKENFVNKLKLLQHIDFSYIYPNQTDIIIQKGLKIKTIRGELHTCSEADLIKFLEYLAPTLEELYLECHDGKLKFPKVSRKMDKVRKLELKKFHLDIQNLEDFSELKRLKLTLVNFDKGDEFNPAPNLSMESLTLEICRELSPKILVGFGKLFPYLRKIDLPYYTFKEDEDKDFNLFGTMCKEFRKLEEINLSLKVCRNERRRNVSNVGSRRSSITNSDTFVGLDSLGMDFLKGLGTLFQEAMNEGEKVKVRDRDSLELIGYLDRNGWFGM